VFFGNVDDLFLGKVNLKVIIETVVCMIVFLVVCQLFQVKHL